MSTVSYVAGEITVSDADTPLSLINLIQDQLLVDIRGASVITLQTDSTGALFIGDANVSSTNYGFTLASNGSSRIYERPYNSAVSPLRLLYVLMSGAGTFHVEVIG